MKKMSSLSRVGLGLSLVFICLLLALIAEIYYLLWWKRRIIISREIEAVNNYRKPRRNLSLCYFWCWKKQVDSSSLNTQIHHHPQSSDYGDQEFQFQPRSTNKDFILSSSMEEGGGFGFETELILSGPPRFLFTINEETREDLDSEDGNKSMEKKRNSLNDLFINNNSSIVSTPTYLTPVSSPQFVTPPITPIGSCHSSQSGGGYNPFYESSNDAEFSRIVKNSPPPRFKFLRDAEEKLQRRIMLIEEAKKGANNNNNNMFEKCEEDGSFIRIVVAKNKEIQSVSSSSSNHHHYHSPHLYSGVSSSSSSQVPSSSNRKFETF